MSENHRLVELTAYVYGTATPEERAAFEAHLKECPDCPADLERVRKLLPQANDLLRKPPDTSVEGMMRLMDRAERELKAGGFPPEKRVSPWLWGATAVTLAAVLAVTAFLMMRLQSSSKDTVFVPERVDGG
jgi:anti-sigma factor RsiW